MEKRCTSCGNVEPDSNAEWCSSCGARLPAASEPGSADAPIVCPACGVANAPAARFCEGCGQSLEEERKKRGGALPLGGAAAGGAAATGIAASQLGGGGAAGGVAGAGAAGGAV
ncbi:MAG: zinc ribbon domain-containing protein, partial [Dehalococcoidia bacterium]|nr:zinc ribbon domain-containing protein [Dehalococcoidia bacterium]